MQLNFPVLNIGKESFLNIKNWLHKGFSRMNFFKKYNRTELSINDAQAALLDLAAAINGLKNDRQLAIYIDVPASSISKIRNKRICMGSTIFLKIHEVTDIQISTLREILSGKHGENIFKIMEVICLKFENSYGKKYATSCSDGHYLHSSLADEYEKRGDSWARKPMNEDGTKIV